MFKPFRSTFLGTYYSSFLYYSRRPHFWEDSWTRSDRRENVTNFAFFFPVSLYISFFRNNVLFSDASVYMLLSCRADRRSFPFCTFPSSFFRNGFPLLKLPYNRRRKILFKIWGQKRRQRGYPCIYSGHVYLYIYTSTTRRMLLLQWMVERGAGRGMRPSCRADHFHRPQNSNKILLIIKRKV